MNKKRFLLFLAAIFIFSTLAFAVSAAETAKETGMIGSLLSPVGRIEQVYARFDIIIDAAIYLIIFLGLTQFSLRKIFRREKGGKAITTGIAIVLAFSLALWEKNAGFNIMSFGPVAALVLIALMGYAVWAGIKSMDLGVDTLTMSAIAYVLVYFSMAAVTPNIMEWLTVNIPIVGALLALLGVVFTVILIVKIVMWIISLFGKKEETLEGKTGEVAKQPKALAAQEPFPTEKAKGIQGLIMRAMQGLDKMSSNLGSVKDAPDFLKKLLDFKKEIIDATKNIKHATYESRRIQRDSRYSDEIRNHFKGIRDVLESAMKKTRMLYKNIDKMSPNEVNGIVRDIHTELRHPLSSVLKAESKKSRKYAVIK